MRNISSVFNQSLEHCGPLGSEQEEHFHTTLLIIVFSVAVQVLLFHDQSYEIHYEYTVSLNTTQEQSAEKQREPEYLYIWTHSSWQDCTVQCGGGRTDGRTDGWTHTQIKFYPQ